MDEQNILCEVEAVFTGSVVEVEVVIGGTISTGGVTEHDLLTEESRNKADQHTKEAITGLSAEQAAQWDAIRASEGASIAIQAVIPQAINETETAIDWDIFKETTDENRIEFANDRLVVKAAGRYFFTSNLIVSKSIATARTITLSVRKYEVGTPLTDLDIVSPYPRTISLSTGIGNILIPTVTVMVDIDEPCELVLTATASGTGLTFNTLETDFYSSAGGGSGLWGQNAEAHLYQASDINMQDKSLNNTSDAELNGLAVEATYTSTVWSYLVGLFTTVPKSVLQHLVKIWSVVENLKSRVITLETKVIADFTLPTNQSVASFPEINIANLGIAQGQDFSVLVYLPALPDNAAQANILFRFNAVDTDATKYYLATSDSSAISSITGAIEGSFIMTFRWVGNKVEGNLTSYRITSGTRTVQVTAIGTNGTWLTAVSSFIIRTTQIVTWPAGTRIIIKKM